MTTCFPSMPPVDPCTPEREGFANVRITGDNVVIIGKGYTLVIPGVTIEKGSVVIRPGNDMDVNKVQLTLLASEIWYEDDNRDDVEVQPAGLLLHGTRYREQLHAAVEARQTEAQLLAAAANLRKATDD